MKDLTEEQMAEKLIGDFYKFPKFPRTSMRMAIQNAIKAVELTLSVLNGLHKPEYTSFDFYKPHQFKIEEPENEGSLNGCELKAYFEKVKTILENKQNE